MKKLTVLILTALLVLSMGACAQSTAAPEATVKTGAETTAAAETTEGTAAPETVEAPAPALADGVYLADFNTDSTMFHANEVCEGKGTLTVKDGKMTIHVSLASTSILNLYPGLAEDAQKDGAELLQPSKADLSRRPEGDRQRL